MLGQNSFDTFQKQLSKLTEVWTHAMNDAHKVKEELERLKKDGRDMVSGHEDQVRCVLQVLTASYRMTKHCDRSW